jgi:phosphate transport system substrate-binding protein
MKILALSVALTLATFTAAAAKDSIQITGSSTVLPFATIAAEAFGENFEFNTPIVEGGGTGAGIKKFCEGVEESTTDIVTASRKMKDEETAACAAASVTDITEIQIGYDGIVFASDVDGSAFELTPSMVYLAINKDSTISSWDEIDGSLPKQKMLMLIPGTKHGTREVFDIKVLIQGCKDTGMYDEILAKVNDPKAAENECISVRTDGAVVEIDGDYTETLSRMKTDLSAIGVFGLSFYENNSSVIQVATFNGVIPTRETIAAGEYAVSRPLFIYVKNQHYTITPGLKEFVQYFVSDDLAGPDGIMVQAGLVSDPNLAETQAKVK